MAEVRSVTMPVTGMTCANCAATIERNVRKLPGIQIANVNLANEKLSVEFDAGQLNEQTIIARVERAGYGVAIGKAELPISGLHDSSDAMALEKLLTRQSGVLEAGVSIGTERATVRYIPGMSSIADLAQVIRKAGFDLVQVGETEAVEDVEEKLRSAEVNRQKRLLIIGLALSMPLMAYSMARDFGLVGFANDEFAMLIPASIVQFYVGWQYYVGAFKSLRAGGANMDVLIALGSSVAYLFSLGVTLGVIHSPNVYYETAAVIITLIMLGKFLEARARGQTSSALKALMGLRARTARVVRAGEEQEVDVEKVVVGDLVVVRPGEKVPVDGIISEGKSAFDESMITGESMPVTRGPGDEVIGATINKEGLIRFEATKVGKNTTLAQIVRMVQEAQGSKAPIQKLTDRVSAYFVPAVILIAILTFAAWMLFSRADWTGAMINAVAVLVIACPCALGLATPTAIMVGTTKGAENGILFKNSETMERAGRAQVVVLDKTGTITRGEPSLTDVAVAGGWTEDRLLRLAAGAESGSEHPLGRAIVKAAQEKKLEIPAAEQFQAVSGSGIRATVEKQAVLIGNPRMMRNEGIDLDAIMPEVTRLQTEGKTAMIVAVREPDTDALPRPVGVLAVADTVKPGSRDAIAELKKLGLQVMMITGDNRPTAEAIARQVGIDSVLAEVMPKDKAQEVKKLQERYRVAMVGDGINDAPALAQADVGIAIGTGTDVAMAAAGVTLISGDLHGVGRAISLSRGTLQTIFQNLFWAFFYNVLLIPIAALGLLMPMIAAGAMAFSSIFVVTNSLRLRGFRVQTVRPPQPLWRQLGEMAPYLVLPAGALGLLIALSVGLLQPTRSAQYIADARQSVRFRVFVNPEIPLTPGTPIPLDVEIIDQFGKPFGDYEWGRVGSFLSYADVAIVRRDLGTLSAASLVLDPYASPRGAPGGNSMGMGGGAPTTGPVVAFRDRTLRPIFTFPSEGQYMVFVRFWPKGQDEKLFAIPLTVGTASTPPAVISPAETLPPTVRMVYDAPLKAGQFNYLRFEILDEKGKDITREIQALAGSRSNLYLVDEKETTFVMADFIRRDDFLFSVKFPHSGYYKGWLEYMRGNQMVQLPFVIEVQ